MATPARKSAAVILTSSCLTLATGLIWGATGCDNDTQRADKAVEAGRLTEQVVGSLPQAVSSSGPIPRRNYVDEQIFGRMERDKIPHAAVSSDEEFVRRVYLDATGTLPEPDQVRQFAADKDANKRDNLIDKWIIKWRADAMIFPQ